MGSLSPESTVGGSELRWVWVDLMGDGKKVSLLQDGCSTSSDQEGKSAPDTRHPGLARVSGTGIQAPVTGQEKICCLLKKLLKPRELPHAPSYRINYTVSVLGVL